jgi:lysophospholipase L1-like esterase
MLLKVIIPGARLGVLGLVLTIVAAACGSKSPTSPSPPPAPNLAITCPSAADSQSLDGNPVVVTYEMPRTQNGTAPISTSCSVASGTSFAVGTTTVSCQATDAVGKTAACSFSVTVRPPPRLQYRKYLAFGDSLTEGVISQSATILAIDLPQSYPTVLRRYLQSGYRQQMPEVINAGAAGELASGDGVARFRGVLLANRPEVVLLMEGTNDLLQLQPGATRALAALDSMMREAEGQNVRVCLATVPPQRAGGVRHRDVVAALIPSFNNNVRALAARHGAVLIDVYEGMKDDLSIIGVDDLHPTPAGYEVMAKIFYNAIRNAFDVGTSVVPALGRLK